jgi:DNA-binding transcriptional ArsR family regulator
MSTATATKKKKPAEKARLINVQRAEKVAALFDLLRDPTRVQILDRLDDGTPNVTELCGLIGGEQPAISHHLAILRRSGAISGRRQGREARYELTEVGKRLVAATHHLAE